MDGPRVGHRHEECRRRTVESGFATLVTLAGPPPSSPWTGGPGCQLDIFPTLVLFVNHAFTTLPPPSSTYLDLVKIKPDNHNTQEQAVDCSRDPYCSALQMFSTPASPPDEFHPGPTEVGKEEVG